MAYETELIKKTREYVEKYLHDNINEQLYYHNFKHLQDVATAALEIGQATHLTPEQLETVLVAAWFHDVGYSMGWENHELTSKNLAAEFLRSQGVDEKRIADIGGCIIATKMPQRPTNIMEEVLCDADLHHIASEEFITKSEMLRREISARNETEVVQGKPPVP
jgi:predicted metal-dependent HD superfamily phosphohydrolase